MGHGLHDPSTTISDVAHGYEIEGFDWAWIAY